MNGGIKGKMETMQQKLESIGGGVKIYTTALHHFGTDAVLLADFAAPKKSDTAIDLGSGCGIIPFLWAKHPAPAHITALEMQPNAAALIRASICYNGFEERITVIEGDLREVENRISALHTFSLVTMNPPYFTLNSGYRSEMSEVELARHQLTCTTEDVIACADKLLRFGGRVCICQKPENVTDILCTMRRYRIEPKRLRFVCGKAGKEPYLVLVEGKKGGKSGLKVMSELCVQNKDGTFSAEMLKIYGDYGDGTKG